MNATASPSPEHDQSRRAIALHFAGRTSAASETAMRAHVLTCASCKAYYQRHLLLAQLDPGALPAVDRIAGGLGLRPGGALRGSWKEWRRPRLVLALAVPLAAAVVVAFGPGRRPDRPVDESTFTARGTSLAGGRAPSFWAYRLQAAAGTPRLAEQTIGAGDELAFAYSNPTARPFLMIFGVDEHRHVFWFHPAWPAGSPAPAAVRAATGPGPHELPDAIHQTLDGRRLKVYAAFSDRALDTTTVEAAVHAAPSPDAPPALGEEVVVVERTLRVQP